MDRFTFIDDTHKKKFSSLRSQLPEEQRFKREILAVIYLISGDGNVQKKIASSIQLEKGIFEMSLNPSGDVLVDLSVHLYNDNVSVSPLDLTTLDEKKFSLALNAIALRKFGLSSTYQEKQERLYY